MFILEKAGRLLNNFVTYTGYAGAAIGCIFVVTMAFLICGNVLLRYLLGKPLVFAEEYSAYLLIAIAYLGLAYTARVGGHINMEMVYRRLPKRVKDGLDVVTSLLILVVVGVYFRYCLDLFMKSLEGDWKAIGIMETPLWIPETALVIGLPVLGLEVASRAVKKFIDFQKGFKTQRTIEDMKTYG